MLYNAPLSNVTLLRILLIISLILGAKRPWSNEEDEKLRGFVKELGVANWIEISDKMETRSGKQCRERWHNHLQDGIKKGEWTPEEDLIIAQMQAIHGNCWAKITKMLPGRTDNAVKNRWHAAHRFGKLDDTSMIDDEEEPCTKRKTTHPLIPTLNLSAIRERTASLLNMDSLNIINQASYDHMMHDHGSGRTVTSSRTSARSTLASAPPSSRMNYLEETPLDSCVRSPRLDYSSFVHTDLDDTYIDSCIMNEGSCITMEIDAPLIPDFIFGSSSQDDDQEDDHDTFWARTTYMKPSMTGSKTLTLDVDVMPENSDSMYGLFDLDQIDENAISTVRYNYTNQNSLCYSSHGPMSVLKWWEETEEVKRTNECIDIDENVYIELDDEEAVDIENLTITFSDNNLDVMCLDADEVVEQPKELIAIPIHPNIANIVKVRSPYLHRSMPRSPLFTHVQDAIMKRQRRNSSNLSSLIDTK